MLRKPAGACQPGLVEAHQIVLSQIPVNDLGAQAQPGFGPSLAALRYTLTSSHLKAKLKNNPFRLFLAELPDHFIPKGELRIPCW